MRTFVAVWPDEDTRDRLGALELGGGKNLRLVGPARWHVTLRFLGDMSDDGLPPLGEALVAGAAAVPGPLQCRLGPATAWFTGVRVLQIPATGLDQLARVVHDATLPFAPAPERGEPPFNGHLTLARAKGRLAAAAEAELAGIPFDVTFPVDRVDLVASVPTARGHVYSVVARAPLGSRA